MRIMAMKIMSIRNLLILALAALSASILFYVSQSVQQAQDERAALAEMIAHEKESLRVLKAEWAYLNSPDYLESLADGPLGLQAPDVKDISPTLPPLPVDGDDETGLQPASFSAQKPAGGGR